MTNFIQCGDTIEYTNSGSAIAAGAPVVVGALVGIAVNDIAASTGTGVLMLEGVFNLAKNTSTAISLGDPLYWSASAAEITKTATDAPIGTAHSAAASSDTTVNVKLYEGGDAAPQAAVVAAVSTANGTDLTTTEALANQLKTSLNAVLTALKNAGLMASA